MRKTLNLFGVAATLLLLWLMLSGHYTPLLLTLGVMSSAGVAWLIVRMGLVRTFAPSLRFVLRTPGFQLWLFIQVLKANVAVARLVLGRRLTLTPRVIRVPASQLTALGRATHANAVTLTPGTLSLELGDDYLEIHALTERIAKDLARGETDRRVRALESPLRIGKMLRQVQKP